jgi:hypothetical protein
VKKFLVPVLAIQIIFTSLGVAQSPNALSARKVQDYFQDVESKSYYQQERIRSMKGEMNEYSERLHNLQEKFHKIFYGRSTDELHQSPFGDREKISYPKRKYRDPIPLDEVESIVRRPTNRSETNPPSNQLAFTVEDSTPAVETPVFEERVDYAPEPVGQDYLFGGSTSTQVSSATGNKQKVINASTPAVETPVFEESVDYAPEPVGQAYLFGGSTNTQVSSATGNKQKVSNTTPSSSTSSGAYLILRPGITFPHRAKLTITSPHKEKRRKYKTGEMVTLSSGYDWGRFFVGGGFLYRRNQMYGIPESYEKNGSFQSFSEGSDSKSAAAFIEFGFEQPLGHGFNLITDLGIGYGVSMIEDFSPYLPPLETDRTRLDPFLFASGGVGFSWSPNASFSLQLAYRYLHEDEVPAHAAQVGLKGNF